ncbi:MAG: nickel pincer cofactor biosynthesis protein LarB [Actinomycetota bacterium]
MDINEVLNLLASGAITVDEARDRLSLAGIAPVADFARLDIGRHGRKGIPEVIYARGKSPEQLADICSELLKQTGRALACGMDDSQWQVLESRFSGEIRVASKDAGTVVLSKDGRGTRPTGGKIGILTAGTADIPIAEQARIMAEEMGVLVITAHDVGVAGVHRLVEPLKQMLEEGVAALVVAAGMEGALPSVVAGLAPVPVIGLPASTGYGAGGDGISALLSMLQTCSPGLAVVNIDNGIGAGATAALIANRAAGAG